MKNVNVIENLDSQMANIDNIRKNLLVARKVQLHTGMEGFNSPDAYGIYRVGGGDALGVVGKVFQPMDLNLYLDAIVQSCMNSDINIDLSKLTYTEYCGGAKIVFRLPLKVVEVKTKMKGDILKTALEFRTGFDGLTKISLGYSLYRIWCSNGAGNWQKDIDLSMKNTTTNHAKVMTFTDEIIKGVQMVDNNIEMLNVAALKSVTQAQIDTFITELTGYNVKEYADLTTKKRNILDRINQAVAIEMQNTGANLFSLLQGVTRYTTHDLADSSMEKILYASSAKMNKKAHELVFAQLN